MKKSLRRVRRLKRKVREAERRINKKIHARMTVMLHDEELIKEIDAEIDDAGGPRAFLEASRKGVAS